MSSTESTYWLVEMTGIEGDVERRVFDDPDKLGSYVRVNANDVHHMRIAIAGEANLVELRVTEAFADER